MLLNTDRDRRRPSARAVCLILLGVLLAGGTLATTGVFAQATAGSLVGHVYDTSGAVLPAVEVVLENDQHTPWTTMTDATGRFEFTPVGAGKYRLRAILAGFRSLNEELDLQTSQDWNRSVTMQVGELEETIHVTAHRPAGRTPATAAFAEPVRIGGNIKPPAKLVNVPPVYPQALRDAGMEGTVRMEALIAQDGSVASVRTLSAQVHPDFARSAEAAVRQWRFSQTLLNGVAVEVRMIVSVTFSLTD
jgi:TonB family protein